MRDNKVIKIISLALSILLLSSQLGLAELVNDRDDSRPTVIPAELSGSNSWRPKSRADKIKVAPEDPEESQQSEGYGNSGIIITGIAGPVQYSESEMQELMSIVSGMWGALGALMHNPTDGLALAAYHDYLGKLIKFLDKKIRKLLTSILNKKKEEENGTNGVQELK